MIFWEMWRNGVSVADVVTLPNGKTVVSWPSSTIIYDSEEAARRVHIEHMGGRGEQTEFRFVRGSHERIDQGYWNCIQDHIENAAFASIGGVGSRDNPQCPSWVPSEDKAMYLEGYLATARTLYGRDWKTCEFGWSKALAIPIVEENSGG